MPDEVIPRLNLSLRGAFLATDLVPSEAREKQSRPDLYYQSSFKKFFCNY